MYVELEERGCVQEAGCRGLYAAGRRCCLGEGECKQMLRHATNNQFHLGNAMRGESEKHSAKLLHLDVEGLHTCARECCLATQDANRRTIVLRAAWARFFRLVTHIMSQTLDVEDISQCEEHPQTRLLSVSLIVRAVVIQE